MRQRVLIALALATGPEILLADEPTTALDASVRAGVLDLFTALRTTKQLGIVIISHDINAIARSTDRVAVMNAGRIVESGPTSDILARPRHHYTQTLVSAMPERTPLGRYLPVRRKAEGTPSSGWIPERARPVGVATTIEVRQLNFGYGQETVLHDISLRISAGERVGIVGESGSGKSTLAKLIAGVLPSPEVLVDGRTWHHSAAGSAKRRTVQMVMQDPFTSLTASQTHRSCGSDGRRRSIRSGSSRARSRRTNPGRVDRAVCPVGHRHRIALSRCWTDDRKVW